MTATPEPVMPYCLRLEKVPTLAARLRLPDRAAEALRLEERIPETEEAAPR